MCLEESNGEWFRPRGDNDDNDDDDDDNDGDDGTDGDESSRVEARWYRRS
jgi:hypothetical protein